MYPTYYVIMYTEKENDKVINKHESNIKFKSREEAEVELEVNGFTKVGILDWYKDLNTGGIVSIEAHVQWREFH